MSSKEYTYHREWICLIIIMYLQSMNGAILSVFHEGVHRWELLITEGTIGWFTTVIHMCWGCETYVIQSYTLKKYISSG